jgi:hypothetical protein
MYAHSFDAPTPLFSPKDQPFAGEQIRTEYDKGASPGKQRTQDLQSIFSLL